MKTRGVIDLASNAREAQSHEMICALNLSVAVMMFNHSYAAIGQALEQLIEFCENAVPLRRRARPECSLGD
jgi:hypothetical protein